MQRTAVVLRAHGVRALWRGGSAALWHALARGAQACSTHRGEEIRGGGHRPRAAACAREHGGAAGSEHGGAVGSELQPSSGAPEVCWCWHQHQPGRRGRPKTLFFFVIMTGTVSDTVTPRSHQCTERALVHVRVGGGDAQSRAISCAFEHAWPRPRSCLARCSHSASQYVRCLRSGQTRAALQSYMRSPPCTAPPRRVLSRTTPRTLSVTWLSEAA